VLKALAETLNIEPIRLLLPCTFAASLGFMLPIATAPNTLVYGTGRISLKDMLICGALLDLWGVLIISIIFGVII
jgi:sodium-dependent dicarboxylate transporter 2/3/5